MLSRSSLILTVAGACLLFSSAPAHAQLDLKAGLPMEHPLWQSHFRMAVLPQMPSIQSWRRSGGNADRGVPEAPEARAIADRSGRLMEVMIHNSDIPDGWEREGEALTRAPTYRAATRCPSFLARPPIG